MENRKAFKTLLLYSLVTLIEFAVIYAVGFWRGYSYAGRDTGDSGRAERYESGDAAARESVGRIESGLGGVAEKVRSARREVGESVTGLGELREVGDRIAGRNGDVAEAAGRIEGGIQRIEQIIFEAEKENGVLADGFDCIDPGGGD